MHHLTFSNISIDVFKGTHAQTKLALADINWKKLL